MNTKNQKIEVVLVDNGSSDNSVDKLKKFQSTKFKIHIIELDKNIGFAAGNNIGIDYARKEGTNFVLFLNNDTIVDKNFMFEMMKAADNHKDSGIFSPKIYFAKGFEFKKKYEESELGHVVWSFGGEIDWKNIYAKNKDVDEVDRGQFNKDFTTDFATGAAMFIRAEVIKKLKGFDKNYYLYFEDVDLCQRYKKIGGKITAVSNAIVWHKVSQSSGIGSELNDYFITRNRLYFAQKYATARAKFALFRESIKFLLTGRTWQKKGVVDYLTGKMQKGSWK